MKTKQGQAPENANVLASQLQSQMPEWLQRRQLEAINKLERKIKAARATLYATCECLRSQTKANFGGFFLQEAFDELCGTSIDDLQKSFKEVESAILVGLNIKES